VVADQEYDEMMARYFAGMEEQSRKRLAEGADLIAKFTALAASKGVILNAESFEYIQTTGIVAKGQGIARTLLGPIKTERDGLLPFNVIASRYPLSLHYEGCFAGPDFILMAHPCGAVAELVGIKCGVVSGVFNLESSGVEAPDWRPRHDKHYHEA
jgi:hypothetical protein